VHTGVALQGSLGGTCPPVGEGVHPIGELRVLSSGTV